MAASLPLNQFTRDLLHQLVSSTQAPSTSPPRPSPTTRTRALEIAENRWERAWVSRERRCGRGEKRASKGVSWGVVVEAAPSLSPPPESALPPLLLSQGALKDCKAKSSSEVGEGKFRVGSSGKGVGVEVLVVVVEKEGGGGRGGRGGGGRGGGRFLVGKIPEKAVQLEWKRKKKVGKGV